MIQTERVDRKITSIMRRRRAIQTLKVDISNHFAENASRLWEARSGQFEDEESLRTALDPKFESLVGRIRRWGMPDTAIFRVVRDTALRANIDPSHVSAEADVFAHQYLAKLMDYRTSIIPKSKSSR